MSETPLTRAERSLTGGDTESVRLYRVLVAHPDNLRSDWVRILDADPERVSWSLQFSRSTYAVGGLLGMLEVQIGESPKGGFLAGVFRLESPGQTLRAAVDPDVHAAIDEVWVRYHQLSLDDEANCGIHVFIVRRVRAWKGEG